MKNNFGILISISIANLKLDFGFPFWKLNFEFRDGLDFQFQFSARAHRCMDRWMDGQADTHTYAYTATATYTLTGAYTYTPTYPSTSAYTGTERANILTHLYTHG